MAKAKECDRCDEIYGEREHSLFGDMGMVDRRGGDIDLCPSCVTDLEYFYNYEFDEIEDVKKLLNKKKEKK